ncbi:MAG: hypothetical protein JST84_14665 [Acidobacteria bacterium]|nr:hypothetical protein [Acidobacteriota bacterium]
MIIKLFVQDQNEYGDPAAGREVGAFATRAEALRAAQARVDECLREFHAAGISAEELLRQWSLFGEDVFLLPDEDAQPFSAMDYARLRCHEIVNADANQA